MLDDFEHAFGRVVLVLGLFCFLVIAGLNGVRAVFGTPGLYAVAVGVAIAIVMQARRVFRDEKSAWPVLAGVIGIGFLPPAVIFLVGAASGINGSFGMLWLLCLAWFPALTLISIPVYQAMSNRGRRD